jgi:hypothetical protein
MCYVIFEKGELFFEHIAKVYSERYFLFLVDICKRFNRTGRFDYDARDLYLKENENEFTILSCRHFPEFKCHDGDCKACHKKVLTDGQLDTILKKLGALKDFYLNNAKYKTAERIFLQNMVHGNKFIISAIRIDLAEDRSPKERVEAYFRRIEARSWFKDIAKMVFVCAANSEEYQYMESLAKPFFPVTPCDEFQKI